MYYCALSHLHVSLVLQQDKNQFHFIRYRIYIHLFPTLLTFILIIIAGEEKKIFRKEDIYIVYDIKIDIIV